MVKDYTTHKKASKYINYLLIGYAFCLPFSKAGVNIFETLALLLWLIDTNWKIKWEQYKNNLLITVILLFILFSFLSIFIFGSSDIPYALSYIGKYRHFLIILVIYSYFDLKFIKYLFTAFLSGMLISEIISYGIFFEWWHYKNISPTDPSPFMSHTDYSIYLAFTSIILLINAIFEKGTKQKIPYILFFITVTANLFINGGRTGQVTFFTIIVLSIFLSIKNKIKAITMTLMLTVSIFTLAYYTSPNFQHRFSQAKDDISKMIYKKDFHGDFATRVSLWIIGADQISNNLFVGSGIGNEMRPLKLYTKKHGFDYNNLKTLADHHNTFITIGIQLGIAGLILIFLIFYSIFRLKFNNFKYQILNYTFLLAFVMWSFGGITFHTMNPMVFFALWAGIFNKIALHPLKQ